MFISDGEGEQTDFFKINGYIKNDPLNIYIRTAQISNNFLYNKKNLFEQIINFITTHHGFGKTKYFYNSFVNSHPDIMPNEAAFTYPGPLPNNKETAILMMADAVEARSRSLTVYTEESINEMVESMINSQIADGQFREAPITFRDVETVKTVFKEKIKNIFHTRIAYPEAIIVSKPLEIVEAAEPKI